jgi:anti-sigma regulatory factor (Ser/Thr protein kinase)
MVCDPNQSAGKVPERLEVKISSDPVNLRGVRKQVEDFVQACGMPPAAADAVGLAVNEALANVIRHGYSGATDKPIMVVAEKGSGEVRLSIRDWGKRFDPAQLPARQKSTLEPGGLGLVCIRQLMDEVEFQRLADGMLLKMVKKAAKDERAARSP